MADEHRVQTFDVQRNEFFPDEDLIAYVRDAYGSRMADRMADFMECDPENETGFMRSVRRSLTREIEGLANVW